MTRMIFFLLAAVAVLGTACERHSPSELEETHGGPAAAHGDVPRNPSGSGPVSPEVKGGVTTGQKLEQKEAAPAALSPTPAPKGSSFFPGNK